MTGPPPTLAFLAYHWGDSYLLSSVRDRWVALRRDARYFLVADTLAELEIVVTADYGANPVGRKYDPPGTDDYLAIPGILTGDGGEDLDDDAELDVDTLITVRELRRAFPMWTIIYSAQTRTWIGRTRKKTISQSSAVSLSIALTMIERRERQLARDPGKGGVPPRDDGTPI
jgi:hypothetical protein